MSTNRLRNTWNHIYNNHGSAADRQDRAYNMSDKASQPATQQQHQARAGAALGMENVRTSPFFLGTASLAMVGWLIAFFGSIAANVQSSSFPHFAWWAIMFQLVVLAGTLTAIVRGVLDQYRLAICAFLASALSFTSSTANVLIYSSSSAEQATAAGHIFLSMINISWILYFGSTPESLPHRLLDTSAQRAQLHYSAADAGNALYPPGKYGSPYPKSNMEQVSASLKNPTLPTSGSNDATGRVRSPSPGAFQVSSPLGPPASESSQTLDFKYRARAIYTYEANAEDPNEIGFAKGEVLEVADISGKWFQARNAKGEVGIAPSNYLTLIADA